MRFAFLPVVDGDEYPAVQRSFEDRGSAIAHGKDVLRLVVEPVRPKSAYVAVFCGEVDGGEPLGAWDWTREVPEPVWAEDD